MTTFDVNAIVVRRFPCKWSRVKKVIMSDGTFRVYSAVDSSKDPGVEHFAVGIATGKTDDEIILEMSHLLCGSGVQFYHEDGTPHD